MKNKFLMTAYLGLISIAAYAQKGELNNAQKQYDSYTVVSSQRSVATAALAKSSLNDAKTSIDKASTNQKTAELPQTYGLKAAIYGALALQDSVPTTSIVSYNTAADALKKAQELDTKGENKKLLDQTTVELAQYMLNKGVGEYQKKKFNDAYKSFDSARQLIPDDTTALMNTSIAAINIQNYSAAITNYNKLLTLKYSGNNRIYEDMPNLYLANKDTAGALKVLADGIAKYPNDNELRKREIEINLQAGHQSDLIGKIEAAIKNDPQNKTLYYYEGLTYSQIAEGTIKDYKKALKKVAKETGTKNAKDIADLNALRQTKDDNYAKAAEMYKKALALDPNYFEANLNLGYVIIAPAIDLYNEAKEYPVSKQKEFDAAVAKFNAQFDLAKPYLLKAVDLNPKSIDALTNLKSYYLGKQDVTNANLIQKKIDAIPAQ